MLSPPSKRPDTYNNYFWYQRARNHARRRKIAFFHNFSARKIFLRLRFFYISVIWIQFFFIFNFFKLFFFLIFFFCRMLSFTFFTDTTFLGCYTPNLKNVGIFRRSMVWQIRARIGREFAIFRPQKISLLWKT